MTYLEVVSVDRAQAHNLETLCMCTCMCMNTMCTKVMLARAPPAPRKKVASSAAAAERIRGAVRHLLGPRTELFAASRYFAAAEARNEIIVSMDDDVMSYPSQAALVEALQCSVRRELGLGWPVLLRYLDVSLHI